MKDCTCFDCIHFAGYGLCFSENEDYYSYNCEFDEENPINLGDSDDGFEDKDNCINFKIDA